MINSGDHWVYLDGGQIERLLSELALWAASYEELVSVLKSKRPRARVLVRRDVDITQINEFMDTPVSPAIKSSFGEVMQICIANILSRADTQYIAFFDYMQLIPNELKETVRSLGGVCYNVAGAPVVFFPRGSQGIGEFRLFRDPHFSPVSGMKRSGDISSATDALFYVFDQETVIYVET